MLNFLGVLKRIYMFFFLGFGALLSGSPLLPAGPSTCPGMAQYLGLTEMPAGLTCKAPVPFMDSLFGNPDGYTADGTITLAAADAWLATLPPGFSLTQQPCWTDGGSCNFDYTVASKVGGVRQVTGLAISARANGADVAFSVTSGRLSACSEQGCPAGPQPEYYVPCSATVAALDSLAGPSAATNLGDGPNGCSYLALATHPWYEATYYNVSQQNLDAWMAQAGSVQSVTCPVVDASAFQQSCWHITAASSRTADVEWRQAAADYPSSVTVRVTL